MHVTKIKIKQDRVFVEYDKSVIVEEKELLNKYSIDSPEQPVGAFKKAFQKMDFFLIELCELCDKPADVPIMCDDVTISGLSFKYKDGELLSAIITGTKALAYSNSPLVLNTPNKSICGVSDEFDRMKHLTDPCIASLQVVLAHAEQYVDGKRLQVEMKLNDQSEKKPKSTEQLQFDEREETTHITDAIGEGMMDDKKVQSANLGPEDTTPKKEIKDTGVADVSRETVKKSGDMAEADWKVHPHNPDSPNFIGDAAIQQINDFDDRDELQEPPA